MSKGKYGLGHSDGWGDSGGYGFGDGFSDGYGKDTAAALEWDMITDNIGFIDGCGFGSDFTCEDSGNKRGYGNGCSIGHGARDGSGGYWPRIENNYLCGYGCGEAEGNKGTNQ